MSTLSQDLDYFDASAQDNFKDLLWKSSSKSSEKSKDEEEDELLEEEENEEKECLSDKKLYVDEKKIEHQDNFFDYISQGFCNVKVVSEKQDTCSDGFSLGAISDQDAISPRSLDSWDLPTGPVPWDDNLKPMEHLLHYADLTLTEEEVNGLLTDRIVAACSSYLTASPGHKCHIAAKVILSNKSLNNIQILGYHRFLQYVDLSWNNLTDLTPLGCLPYLMYLDVSHNLMEEVLRFRPPLNLTYVNYSYNEAWQIDDLTDFWSICYLDLSHNKISKIQGLDNLKYLRYLDLSYNKIERFENLNDMRITDLNLEYNLISRFETEMGLGISTMPCLTNLYLNNNLIKSLEFLKKVHHLKKLELQGNNISDLLELSEIKHLKNLRQLDLSGNPVSTQKPYRSLVLSFLEELRFLDQTEVTVSERVAACKKNRFDIQLEAARQHARMVLLEQFNDTTLGMDVLPLDKGSHPFVILVGPSASSKKLLISCLAEKHPDKIYIGKLHTTRKVLKNERHLLQQVNRETFNDLIQSGKFLAVYENIGHFYGFSRDELGKSIKEHKLCLTAMDMVSALTIHSYGIQPFLILTILRSKEEHIKRLKMTYGPVISAIGTAYMANRQFLDSHQSNVRRVQNILSEILEKIILKSLECNRENDDNKSEICDDLLSRSLDLNNERKSCSTCQDSENSSTPKCYKSEKACYPCTPSKCGYQTYRSKVCEEENMTRESEEVESLISNDGDIKEVSSSSYSENILSPLKVEFTSSEVSTYGEQDPFADISMPFIDWSEVNFSGLEQEEAAEILCNHFIEDVMSTRDIYQNLHLDNPGLFSLCVFTDDVNKATKKIKNFLKEVWRKTSERKPPFDIKEDLIYQTLVPKKLSQLEEMLRNDFLSSGDGSANCTTEIPSMNSSAAIYRETRMKGYGDSLDGL